MSDKDYDYYDTLVHSLNNNMPDDPIVFRSNGLGSSKFDSTDTEAETFLTSEDIAREKKLQEEASRRDGKVPRSLGPNQVEESVFFRYNAKAREIKYTKEELESFREGCKRVIVHDYGKFDFYHMSDSEREKNDQLARISMKVSSLKHIYRSVDKYIEAMRVYYEAWSLLAEGNYIFTRKEFFDMVARGTIVSNRITTPILKGIKDYNPEVIFQYINNKDLDPRDLLPKTREDPNDYLFASDDEQFDRDAERLLSPEEIEYVAEHEDRKAAGTADKIAVTHLKKKYLKAYSDELNLRTSKKKHGKSSGTMRDAVNKILRSIQNNHYKNFNANSGNYGLYGITENLFDEDRSKVYKDPIYRGSWQNSGAVKLFELAMEEERLGRPISDNSSITYGDNSMESYYRMLEDHGVNTVELRRCISGGSKLDYIEKRKKESRKLNRKIELSVIKRIQSLSRNPRFQKLIKKSEKDFDDYNNNVTLDSELDM